MKGVAEKPRYALARARPIVAEGWKVPKAPASPFPYASPPVANHPHAEKSTEGDEAGRFGDGGQKKRHSLPIRVTPVADDLPGIVDGMCLYQCDSR